MSSTQASKQLRDEDAEVTREFEKLIKRELELIGEDPDREGLARTPARVAKSLRFLTQGYDSSPEEVVGKGVFKEEHDNMIMVRDIEL
ncbi:MAG TPA: GTP cyclohydrolase I, partial [Gemmatimonadaceae bacterium]